MKNSKLFETHIKTINLEEAISFYKKLGLKLATFIQERRVAFFWLGDPGMKEQMLGIWEVEKEEFIPAHFAFYVEYDQLFEIPAFLHEKNIPLTKSFGLDTSDAVVHAWMPSASYYFSDPDGNSLEYITNLEGEPDARMGTLHLKDWLDR
ncbi:catechol 2,3-dioxygenase-like lactoylglutathione lyase family enzyme [Bacillus tianshenii]|uniref:Catechol 2,3-dioxygenase-like lactoylglutathione lyase family enzyme n=1 Tax=Sutcliffiella tianshenii TaxID=1463404 RepID=A0ABS2P3W0_9BACI|nr:VOC family protein [Bacillus tianshenii]MBM7621546.1 catechol 2,3-dioxygenase-like lactoylglutathione lyase family enzyme [Bacillus tianshenii]